MAKPNHHKHAQKRLTTAEFKRELTNESKTQSQDSFRIPDDDSVNKSKETATNERIFKLPKK